MELGVRMPEYRERGHRFRPVIWSAVMIFIVVKPVREVLEKLFGDGAELFTLMIVLIVLVIYAFMKLNGDDRYRI